MATNKKPADTVWDDIFDSLVLDAEPPQKYVKKVTITTKDGHVFNISPQDFAALVEHERYLPPELGEIQSARMSLDFNRIRRDVDKWADDLIKAFDTMGKPATPKFPKPKAGEPKARKQTKKTASPSAKKVASTGKTAVKKKRRKPSAD